MKKNNTTREVISYEIDKILAKGTPTLILILTLFSLLIVIFIGLLAFSINSNWSDGSSYYSIWKTIMFLLDAGNLSNENSSIVNIFLMSIVTLLGIFVTSTLIGIINNGIQNRIFRLRNGNSKIIEENHTIILGFNEGIFSILSELIKSNENKIKPVIVILGNLEKPIMEDIINDRIPIKRKTKIICHSGNTSDILSLEKCSVLSSKSIIVNESNDFDTLKCILAVVSILEKTTMSKSPFMTVVIKEYRNLRVAKLASKGYAEVLHFDDIIARIIAHTSYQSGLSKIFTELLDFDGDEIYIEKFPELAGKTFSDVLLYFKKSTVIGLKNDECKLNPPMNTIIDFDDFLILIAEDDGVSTPVESHYLTHELNFKESDAMQNQKKKEKLLVLEFNHLLHGVVKELDNYLDLGSKMTIAHSKPLTIHQSQYMDLLNLEINFIELDIYNPEVLEKLLLDGYSSIFILSDANEEDEVADSKTLMLLMQLRSLIEKYQLDITVTSEIKNVKNQVLASSTHISDFVVSSNIISLMVTQVSENRDLLHVFEDLLNSEGSEIYVRDSTIYVHEGNYIQVAELCKYFASQNKIFIGFENIKYQKGAYEKEIKINPPKDEFVTINESLKFILISEN